MKEVIIFEQSKVNRKLNREFLSYTLCYYIFIKQENK